MGISLFEYQIHVAENSSISQPYYSVLASSLLSPPKSDDPSPGGEKCVQWVEGRLRQDPFRIRRVLSWCLCWRNPHIVASDSATLAQTIAILHFVHTKYKFQNIKYVFGCSEHKLHLVQIPGNKVGWRKH